MTTKTPNRPVSELHSLLSPISMLRMYIRQICHEFDSIKFPLNPFLDFVHSSAIEKIEPSKTIDHSDYYTFPFNGLLPNANQGNFDLMSKIRVCDDLSKPLSAHIVSKQSLPFGLAEQNEAVYCSFFVQQICPNEYMAFYINYWPSFRQTEAQETRSVNGSFQALTSDFFYPRSYDDFCVEAVDHFNRCVSDHLAQLSGPRRTLDYYGADILSRHNKKILNIHSEQTLNPSWISFSLMERLQR